MSTLDILANGMKLVRGVIKDIDSGRKLTEKKIYDEYKESLRPGEEFLGKADVLERLHAILTDRQKEEREEKLGDTQYPTIFTVAEFIEQAVTISGYSVDQRGESIKKGVDNAGYEDLEYACYAHRVRYLEDSPRDEKGRPERMVPSQSDIKIMLHDWLRERDFQSRAKLRTKLAYDAELKGIDKKLKKIFQMFNTKTPLKLSVYVLKQWMWQVKRYMNGLPVEAPLLINIYGTGQGTGKTTFTEELTKVFGSYRQHADLSQAMDSRHNKLWTENYVILFDELAKGDGEGGRQTASSSKASLSVLKFLLTSKQIAQRDMGRTRFSKGDRTFSALSSSNVPVSEILFDPTGMRRFFEIEILADIKKEGGLELTYERVDFIKSLDMFDLWRQIDEEGPGYILPNTALWERMVEIQNGYKKPDNLDFLFEIAQGEGCEHLPLDEGNDKESLVLDLAKEGLGIKKIQEEADVILSTATQFYIDIKEDWAGADYKDEIRWIPKDMKLMARCKQKGWSVLQINDTWYILRERVADLEGGQP